MPEVILLMDLMPPISTSAVNTASTIPTMNGSTPKVPSIAAATEFDWVMLPMPKEAITAAMAKNSDKKLPKRFGMAFFR
ncbi:hypothetical protein SDC9_150823 [bioreactor metagenome]|uniref:Uncharacterized protein n=1 Tax=bioreactor metagenome TaxID=1076179 RepID=A0A645EQP9_9ZZZZ